MVWTRQLKTRDTRMPNYLTFDLGTTLYKVALFDNAGRLLALERAIPPIEHPHPGWSIVQSSEASGLLFAMMAKLRKNVGDAWRDIRAVSYATQANTFSFTPTSDASTYILWSDQRAADLTAELSNISHMPDFRSSTGLSRLGPLSSLAKVLWLRRNDPSAFKGAEKLCFLSYEILKHLAGENCVEAGEAALTGALDIRTLRWRKDILNQLGVPPLKMPAVYRAGAALRLIPEEMGFSKPCLAVVGCLDQYAGAIGTGTVEPGRMCETTGTVLAAVRCADALADDPPPGVFQGPSFESERDLFWQMSFSSTSANLLEWYRNQLPGQPTFESLTEFAQSAPPSDLTIEPYDDQGSVEASFRHVRAEHMPGQIVRAIMQRVALSLKQQVDQLSQGNPPTEIRSAGGAARNDYWLQMKADTLGIPFVAMDCEEPTSLGAAMLAAGALGSVQELAGKWCRPRARFTPK